jgi:hypothetical protein
MLAPDRFYKCTVTKRFTVSGLPYDVKYDRFTYESATKIYDVDVRRSDGDRTYHVNGGFETEQNQFHRAIEEHFGLNVQV